MVAHVILRRFFFFLVHPLTAAFAKGVHCRRVHPFYFLDIIRKPTRRGYWLYRRMGRNASEAESVAPIGSPCEKKVMAIFIPSRCNIYPFAILPRLPNR